MAKSKKAPKKTYHIRMQEGEALHKFNDYDKAREMLAKLVDITGGHGLYICYMDVKSYKPESKVVS